MGASDKGRYHTQNMSYSKCCRLLKTSEADLETRPHNVDVSAGGINKSANFVSRYASARAYYLRGGDDADWRITHPQRAWALIAALGSAKTWRTRHFDATEGKC